MTALHYSHQHLCLCFLPKQAKYKVTCGPTMFESKNKKGLEVRVGVGEGANPSAAIVSITCWSNALHAVS